MDVYGEINGTLSMPQTLAGGLSSVGRIGGAMGTVHGEIKGSLSASSYLVGKLSTPAVIEGDLSIPSSVSAVYTGAYEFTPTRETQTININHKEAVRNITINPIPQNYGLITYNGSIITVS